MNIPGYQLGRKIAVGEYCSVYNALEIESSKTVTIKFFLPELSSNPEFCRHLKATSQRLLNTPIDNIVSIKKAEWKAEGCYLISDYFPFAQNQQPLQTKFTIDEVLNFGLQLANSLSKLHSTGLVHGGVSTSNLIFPDLSRVTMGPVSIQRTFRQDSSLPISLDEACYIAPEFFTGSRLSPSSDFYSLGVVLFELLVTRKPFIADDLQQLQIKKEQMQYEVPVTFPEKLKPLFEKLLATDPEQRIKNAAEYNLVIKKCGYKDNTSANAENVTSSVDNNNKPRKSSSKSHSKNLIIYSAIAGLLMLAIISFFIHGDRINEQGNASNTIPPVDTDITGIYSPEVSLPVTQTDNLQAANELYQKGLQQMSQNNYGEALMSINNALKEQPGHVEALQTKARIEQEFEIRAYLSRAEKLLQEGKLTKPENDNAYKTYTALSPLLPDGDTRALDGLKKITSQYYRLANNLVLQKQYNNARQYISAGLSVIADDTKLKQLNVYINQQEAIQIEQQRKRIERQQATEQELQRQQQVIEQNRIAALERQKALKVQQQKQRENEIKLEQKRLKIENLLDSARGLLRSNQLSLSTLNSSLEIHRELTTLTTEDSRVSVLFAQIVDSFGDLARNQKDIPDLEKALSTVDQGLALDRNNINLQYLKKDIEELIIEADQKQNEVPFIGTF